jgi:periplasmic copper chaperone A
VVRALAALVPSATAGGSVLAHTETDLVAVPAGSEAVASLRPTHGCNGSPTVTVRIQAPLEGAVAEPVDGWQESASPDGAGNTVLEWSGGVLPADTTGAFPVSFNVPDEPRTLLVFPAVQRCEDGQELAWINGDPAADYPAPRVLVLPVGSEPAASIDDVPLDAPGRDQLVAIVDVDAPTTTITTTPIPATTQPPATTAVAPTTTAPPDGVVTTTARTEVTSAPSTTIAEPGGDDDDDDGAPVVFVAVLVAVLAAATAVVAIRRRR